MTTWRSGSAAETRRASLTIPGFVVLRLRRRMTAAIPVPRFDHFYRYAELTRLLQDYAAALPGLVQLASIGRSHEGRDIWLVTVTNSVTGPAEVWAS